MSIRLAVPLLLGLVACVRGGASDVSAFHPSTAPPKITGVDVACDPEAGTWTMQIATDAWAGAAFVVWTLDGVYLERHSGFRSVAADPDGTSDRLRDDVGIVADFRPASDGATAFTCRDVPTAAFVVLDLDRKVSDCVRAGRDPALLDGVTLIPACPRVLDDGTDTDSDTDADTDAPDSDG